MFSQLCNPWYCIWVVLVGPMTMSRVTISALSFQKANIFLKVVFSVFNNLCYIRVLMAGPSDMHNLSATSTQAFNAVGECFLALSAARL